MGRLSVSGLALLAAVAISPTRALFGQLKPSQISININESRPLAKASLVLENKFGLAVSYEDAQYTYSGDLIDMTSPAYKQTHPDSMALIPRNGILNFTIDPLTLAKGASAAAPLAQQVVDQHTANGNAGQFQVIRLGDTIAIVPVAVRNSAGIMSPAQSPLDARISLPILERDSQLVLRDFCQTLSDASGRTVSVGTLPAPGLAVTIGASNEVARDVLIRIISGFQWKDSRNVAKLPKLTWSMLYDPSAKAYLLHVHQIRREHLSPDGVTIMTPVSR